MTPGAGVFISLSLRNVVKLYYRNMLNCCVYLRMELCSLLCYSVDCMLFFVLSHEPHSHSFFSVSKCFLCNIHAPSCSNERIRSNPGSASFPLQTGAARGRLTPPLIRRRPPPPPDPHPPQYVLQYLLICRCMHDGGTAA